MQGTRKVQSTITYQDGYLKAEISDRQTAQETRDFLRSIVEAAAERECTRALVTVKDSRSLFKVEEYGISAYFKLLAANPSYRVALLSNSDEVRASHEYIVLLAKQYGAQVRSFRSEAEAVAWLVGD
jgi:hypothetical protein